MTPREIFSYLEVFYREETEKTSTLLKAFAFYNLETTALAHHGKRSEIIKYVNTLSKCLELKENNIDEQFEELDFGE